MNDCRKMASHFLIIYLFQDFPIGLLGFFPPHFEEGLYIRKVRSSLVIGVVNIFISPYRLYFDLPVVAFAAAVLFFCSLICQCFLLWLLGLTHPGKDNYTPRS